MSIAGRALHALILEDSPADAEAILRELSRVGYNVTARHLNSTESVADALSEESWDIVFSDSSMADSGAGGVLQLLHQDEVHIPWLLITDGGSGETASSLTPNGTEFISDAAVPRDHLAYLGPSVARLMAENEALRKRQEAESALRESEERYRILTETAFDLICEIDEEGRYSYVSPNYQQVLGYTPTELAGETIFQRLHGDDAQAVEIEFTASLAAARTGQVECRYQHKNGEWHWFKSTLRAIRGADGSRRVVMVSRDFTERKRHESELSALISLAKAINAQSQIPTIAKELLQHLQPLMPFDSLGILLLQENDLRLVASTRQTAGGVQSLEPEKSTAVEKSVPGPTITLRSAPQVNLGYKGIGQNGNGNGTNGHNGNGHNGNGHGPKVYSYSEAARISRQSQPDHPLWATVAQRTVQVVNQWSAPKTLANSSVAGSGVRAFIQVPLLVDNNQLVGVLHFDSQRPYVFTEEHVRLAGMVGEQVVVAVRQTQLLAQARAAEEKYKTLVNDVDAIVWVADAADLRFTFVSPQAQEWLGFPLDSWLTDAEFWPAHIHEEDRPRVLQERREAVASGNGGRIEYRVHKANGELLWLRDLISVETRDGQPVGVRGIMVDITERKHAEGEVLRGSAVLRATQEAAADGIFVVDNLGFVVSNNQRFIEMWHIPDELVDELRQKQQLMAYVLSTLQDPNEFINKISELYDEPGACTRDEIHLKDDRIFERYSAPACSPNGEFFGRVWSFSDITERRGYERQLAHQAFHDPLTDLPNRALFMDRLTLALARAKRANRQVAVLFLDLNRFKVVNDSLGHHRGDELLVEVAQRLRTCVRPTDTAARFGGDEFTVLVEEIAGIEDAITVAERIAASLQFPFQIASKEIFVSASVGIAHTDVDGEEGDTSALGQLAADEAEDLLRKADVAMYRAKNKGLAYEVFNVKMCAQALDRLQLELDLRQAVKRQQLQLYYQAQVNLETNRIVGLEALIRWEHPMRGLISPLDFIPLAEETGMIMSIGKWVLREACTQGRAWQQQFPTEPDLKISVNLSARQFQQPGLAEEIGQILRETGMSPKSLELEITESVIMDDVPAAIGHLKALKELGVELAIDDFGTGYSSLSYLEHFPLDVLKIDRSFINQIGHNGDGMAILRAISTMGQTLGVRVIAEGIETVEQLSQVRTLECQIGQGYHFSKPIAADAVESLLQTYAAGAV